MVGKLGNEANMVVTAAAKLQSHQISEHTITTYQHLVNVSYSPNVVKICEEFEK